MLLIALHSTHGVVKAKRDVRPSHAKQGLEPSFVARSPLHRLPQTGKEVRSKRGDLNLFQVLNLRASTLFADADHVSQPDSILSQDFCLHILFLNSNPQSGSLFPGLLSFAPSPSGLPKTHIQNLGAEGSSHYPQRPGNSDFVISVNSANVQVIRDSDFQLQAAWKKVKLLMLQSLVTPGLGTANLRTLELCGSPQCPVS